MGCAGLSRRIQYVLVGWADSAEDPCKCSESRASERRMSVIEPWSLNQKRG